MDSQTSYYEAVPENAFLGEITVDKVTVQTYADQASPDDGAGKRPSATRITTTPTRLKRH